MHTNIFAYTAPGAVYPEYVSVNETDGNVAVTARGPKGCKHHEFGPYEVPGETVSVVLPRDEVGDLCRALAAFVGIELAETPDGK